MSGFSFKPTTQTNFVNPFQPPQQQAGGAATTQQNTFANTFQQQPLVPAQQQQPPGQQQPAPSFTNTFQQQPAPSFTNTFQPSATTTTASASTKENITQYLIDSLDVQKNILNEIRSMKPSIQNITQVVIQDHGIVCDKCNSNIQFARYKCCICPSFNLCEKCEVNCDTFHEPAHFFLKIRNANHFKAFFKEHPGVFANY